MTGPDPDGVGLVYDRQARAFDARRRSSVMEAGWTARFIAALPAEPEVLDLGCGSGEPIARALIAAGSRVTGLDASDQMLAIARARFAQAEWILGDMAGLELGRSFDGIIAWHSLFHLTATAQRQALPRIIAHLRPGGILMMTTGLEQGEGQGLVEGEAVYHASLDAAEYRTILTEGGLEVLDLVIDDPTCGGANIWFARRS